MKTKQLLTILFLTLFSISILAQQGDKPIDLKGKYALQFQIDRYFTISDFQGGTISGKYHFNNSSAIRMGVNISTLSEDSERSFTIDLLDTTMSSNRNSTVSYKDIMFLAEYLYYSAISDNISMYLGAGISYSTSPMTGEEITSENNSTFSQTDKVEWDRTGYGAQVLIGVEWFVRSNIGITAEYSSKYYSEERETTMTMDDGEGSKLTEIHNSSYSGFEYDRVKFGVSIYF